jgi:Holliday junction resolvase-like predicted endonuclease
MEISKSTRHAKITGDFGESLILYWLSKYGFECAKVDHTGIDLIARNPHNEEVMGISVKSRSRIRGKESTYIRIPNDNFSKAEAACKAFGCIPYFAFVVDAADFIRAFLLPLKHLLKLSPMRKGGVTWKMTKSSIDGYYSDPTIMIFELQSQTLNWWRTKKDSDLF